MHAVTLLTEEELEDGASRLLGKLLFAFGRIEMNLALFLGGLQLDEPFDRVMARLEKCTFDDKLDILLDAVGQRYDDDIELYGHWAEWYMAADSLRDLRNRLAHGRWGIIGHLQIVAHVAGLPGSPKQKETRYSLALLGAEVAEAPRIVAEFSSLRRRWACT